MVNSMIKHDGNDTLSDEDKAIFYRDIMVDRLKDHRFAVEFELNENEEIAERALEIFMRNDRYTGQSLAYALYDYAKDTGLVEDILNDFDDMEKILLIDLYMQRFAVYGFLRERNIDIYLDTMLTIIKNVKECTFEESINVVLMNDIKEWFNEVENNIVDSGIDKEKLESVNSAAKNHLLKILNFEYEEE